GHVGNSSLPVFAAAALFVDSTARPAAPAVAALAPASEEGAGAVANPFLNVFNPLKSILASLGIPVEQLVEGSRKCVTELGPEAVEAVKALLGALTLFGCTEVGVPLPGDKMLEPWPPDHPCPSPILSIKTDKSSFRVDVFLP
ncbi:hypothetical protein HPG69_018466, partial [Diceros bicornis minor]